VIDQFMDFARDERNEPLESIDLNLLIRAHAERAGRAGARITLDLDPQAILKIRPLAIKRLLANLVDNARKHAGDDITITTRREPGFMVLAVADRGPGIPASEVERLKQPFTRLDASAAPVRRRSGWLSLTASPAPTARHSNRCRAQVAPGARGSD
jgi:two-component system osmolarity sensor histidine kinase EnvZ